MALDGNGNYFMPVEPANNGFGDMGGMWLVLPGCEGRAADGCQRAVRAGLAAASGHSPNDV